MNLIVPTSNFLAWLSSITALSILLWALKTASWKKLFARSERQHMWYGAVAFLSFGWSLMSVNVQDVFRLHPMLITSLTLIFGFRLALIAAAIAFVVTTIWIQAAWQSLGLSWLVSAVLPAAATFILWRLVSLSRIQNLFLYTLGVGFVGGLLTPAIYGLSTIGVLWLSQCDCYPFIWHNAYLFFMFIFPEGFLNGMIVSALAVMAPHLLKTYDDDFYLK